MSVVPEIYIDSKLAMLKSSRLFSVAFIRCRPLRRGVRTTSLQVIKTDYLPEGFSLEILTDKHDMSQLRKLLVDAFAWGNEPIIRCLCQKYYPKLSTIEQVAEVAKKFEMLHHDQALLEKINEGLSLVAVKDEDPKRYVSVAFAETYQQGIYQNESLVKDQFCQDALGLMRAVHEKAEPFISGFDPNKVAFMSHGATISEYRSTGVMHACLEFILSRLAKKGFQLAYTITSTKRLARFAEKQLGYHQIAEVEYGDYLVNGEKVFGNHVENESVTAIVKSLSAQ